MQRFVVWALVSAFALTAAGIAATAQPPIRIRDEAAAVRVVVHVPGASLAPGTVEAVDSKPVEGTIVVAVAATAATARASAAGVTVRLSRSGIVTAHAHATRFKYLGLSTLPTTHDVILVLWKRTPTAGAAIRRGEHGCLTIDTWHATHGEVTATGREAGIFEHSFALRVRDARGNLVGIKPVTATKRRWHATVRARVATRQTGMLEAYDPGASDGALGMCLAQVLVQLRP